MKLRTLAAIVTASVLGASTASAFSNPSTVVAGTHTAPAIVNNNTTAPDQSPSATMPEPTSLLLLGAGLVGIGIYGRHRHRRTR